jgi:hypothetical protein
VVGTVLTAAERTDVDPVFQQTLAAIGGGMAGRVHAQIQGSAIQRSRGGRHRRMSKPIGPVHPFVAPATKGFYQLGREHI